MVGVRDSYDDEGSGSGLGLGLELGLDLKRRVATCGCVRGLTCQVEHCCVLLSRRPSATAHSLARDRSTEGRGGPGGAVTARP